MMYLIYMIVEDWSGQRDSNPRPSAPKADALPDCAMPRKPISPASNRTVDNTRTPKLRQFGNKIRLDILQLC